MLCKFLLYNKVNQLYVYIHSFPPESPFYRPPSLPPKSICPSWVASGRTTIIASVPGGPGPRAWTGLRLLSRLFCNFRAQYFVEFFDENTLLPYPWIMTALDPIFSSLQRGSRQAARLCCDQLKQLISCRQEPNYSICKITSRYFDLPLLRPTGYTYRIKWKKIKSKCTSSE